MNHICQLPSDYKSVLGRLEQQKMVVVIAHTESEREIRIISMRKATKNEQKIYDKGFSS